MNRLQHETSPYLLQHANNPVDWYPWGDEAPRCTLVNYLPCYGDTMAVGSLPAGASPYGALDMAELAEAIGPKTKFVAMTHMSNVLGTVTDMAEIVRRAPSSSARADAKGAASIRAAVRKAAAGRRARPGAGIGLTVIGVSVSLWGQSGRTAWRADGYSLAAECGAPVPRYRIPRWQSRS